MKINEEEEQQQQNDRKPLEVLSSKYHRWVIILYLLVINGDY